MVQALVSDHLGLTFWMVAYERFNCICFAFDSWTADYSLYNKGVINASATFFHIKILTKLIGNFQRTP